MPAPAAADLRPQTSRVLFLDLARAAAVIFMIQGHTVHKLLDLAYFPGLGFQAWLYLRGLTSCLFLLLSGFSFSVASDRYWDEIRRPSRRLFRRLARFAFFLALGYLIQFPMGRFSHLQFADQERWRSFLRVDILQVVAGSLLLLQALAMLLKRRLHFALACAGAAAYVALATPALWSLPLAGALPLWLVSYLTADTGSYFPLFPWGAFIFAGAAIGMVYARRGVQSGLRHTAAVLAASGAVLLLVGAVAFHVPFQPLWEVDPWKAGPSIFAARLGSSLLLLGGFALVSRHLPRLPRVVRALSQESLVIYLVHVAILYGSLWTPALADSLGRQDLRHTIGWIVVLSGSMTALAWAWNASKRRGPILTYALRIAVAWMLVRPLL